MKRPGFLSGLFIFVVVFSLHAAAPQTNTSHLPEIHLLVDVSGSMKRTDAQNLRAKAIKMFIYLVRKKALMSIDTFATSSQNILPLLFIDDNYDALFSQKKKMITSDGQWTNIESALNEALKSWKNQNKVIILLTDGKIDLNSTTLSSESRDRVLNQTTKKLQDEKIRVFTIGFSNEADKDLLTNLAIRTNAIPQVIRSSADIDTTLYKIFTAVIAVNGVSIEKNENENRTILVDNNIKQMTLIFKKNTEISKLFLMSPKGTKRSIKELGSSGNESLNYFFVNIDKPETGEWVLSGPEQDVERAVILTDVKLISDFKSGIYFNQEQVFINAFIQNKGVVLDDPSVDSIMNMKLTMESGSFKTSYDIPYQTKGKFRRSLYFDNPEGKYTLVLSAKNDYLSRELQYVIDLQSNPFSQNIISSGIDNVTLTKPELIQPDSVQIKVLGDNKEQNSSIVRNDVTWKVDLSSLCGQHPAQLALQIEAITSSKRSVVFFQPINTAKLCPPPLSSLIVSVSNASQSASSIEKINFSQATKNDANPTDNTEENKKANEQQIKKINYKIFFYAISILLLVIAVFGIGLVFGIAYSKKIKKIKFELTENKND